MDPIKNELRRIDRRLKELAKEMVDIQMTYGPYCRDKDLLNWKEEIDSEMEKLLQDKTMIQLEGSIKRG